MFQEHPLMKSYPASLTDAALFDPEHPELEGPLLNQPNTALLSLVLMLGTFFVAFFLRKFRNSRFLGGKVNSITNSFSVDNLGDL